MTPTKADRLKALADLEHVYRVMFELDVWTEDDAHEAKLMMRRALAILHAAERWGFHERP